MCSNNFSFFLDILFVSSIKYINRGHIVTEKELTNQPKNKKQKNRRKYLKT